MRLGVLLVAILTTGLISVSPAHAANPPVIYVHGVSEDACGEGNLRAVLETIAKRLPQRDLRTQGGDCKQQTGGSNPLRFRYVRDRDDRDVDVADGGSSQSGAGANARALRTYINSLTSGDEKVMLVGHSLGGLVIRTYLAQYPAEANRRVAAVAFIESALQGSPYADLARGARESRCAEQADSAPSVFKPIAAAVCGWSFERAREYLKLTQDAIAFRDLTPASEVIRNNADVSLPPGPRYLNLPGDVRLESPSLELFRWTITEPQEYRRGDLIIPWSDESDPSATPDGGGARMLPKGEEYEAQERVLGPRVCAMSDDLYRAFADARATLANNVPVFELLIKDRPLGNRLKEDTCLGSAPESHLNINEKAGEARPEGTDRSVADVVSDFLVKACRGDRLGDCGKPKPVKRKPRIGVYGPLTVSGFGPIRVGMTEKALEKATGKEWESGFQGPCYEPAGGPEGIFVTIESGAVKNIVLPDPSPFTTASGVRIGGPTASIFDAYGSQAEKLPEFNDEVGQGPDVIFVPQEPPDDAYRMVFWVVNGRIGLIAAGRVGIEQTVEFCA